MTSRLRLPSTLLLMAVTVQASVSGSTDQEQQLCPCNWTQVQSNIESKLDLILTRLTPPTTVNCTDADTDDSDAGSDVGVNYKRWGRTTCPDNAAIIYEGRTVRRKKLVRFFSRSPYVYVE